ncbi:MAG: flagellar export chaperone FliS [Proteobacteria bacterium]|nr:flagellar export chaperone FliS [Pseudomonadota bacterium]
MVHKAAQHYRNHQVRTASPAGLVAMLYDQAIASLNDAVRAIGAREIEKRWRANNRAVEIITVLSATLDREQGGVIAENLDRLYQFMIARLIDVDLKNDPAAARDVIGLLQPLAEAWRQLAEQTTEAQQQEMRRAEAAGGKAAAPTAGNGAAPTHANGNGNGNGKAQPGAAEMPAAETLTPPRPKTGGRPAYPEPGAPNGGGVSVSA